MKDSNSKSQNHFNFMSGTSKAIPANSNSYQRAIVLSSAKNIRKRVHGIVIRYKPGLETCGVQIESFSLKNLIKGYLPLGVLGSEFNTPGFHIFPFLGKKPIIKGNEQIEIKIQTKGQEIEADDVSCSLLVEEITHDDGEQEKKNPFYILAGISDSVGLNQTDKKAILLANDFSSDVKIHGWVMRYKENLDKLKFDIYSANLQRSGGIIEGPMSFAVGGAPFGSPAFNMFPIPGKKPVFETSDSLEIQVTTSSTTQLNALDLGIALIVEAI
ncbi:hypothetical protein [Leptospira harrisiae]|uniref:hypothetical protein n=1 Tax=Leptospira harrisiae TaxID=2023189 RepID=UPI000F63DB99|nr:hypothetical protein [Leptospira harrisiae]